MSIEHTVLVLAQENDPQLSMLKGLRHIVGREAAAFASAAKDPVVILAWSGPKKVLRDVFTHVPGRSLGAFPLRRIGQRAVSGVGCEQRPADQRQGCFQPVVGGVRPGGDPLFRQGFSPHDAQPDGGRVGAI